MDNQSLNALQSKRSLKSTGGTGEFIETWVVLPPDGGWGWVIVVVSFCFNFVADGTIYSFGTFLEHISRSFHSTTSQVTLANSLMTGFYFILGPIISGLTNRYGFRIIAISGGIIASTAIILSSIVNNLPLFLFVYGVLGGLGFCMTYMTSIIAVGFYFERWRALATSLAVCGSSMGMVGFPALTEVVLGSLDWRVKFQVLAGIILAVTCLGFLYRPLKPVRVVSLEDKKVVLFTMPSQKSDESVEQKEGLLRGLFCRLHNRQFPTTADLHRRSTITLAVPRDMSSTSVFSVGSTSTNTTFKSLTAVKSRLSKVSEAAVHPDRLETLYEEEELPSNGCRRCCMRCRYRTRQCCCGEAQVFTSARPMYRDDIFFGGSIQTLPGYSKSIMSTTPTVEGVKTSALDYHLSMTRSATIKDYEEARKFCVCCPESIKRTIATMWDVSIMKSHSFLLLSISGFFTIMGMYTPFIFMTQKAEDCGMEKALYLLPILGIANTVGRIMSGVISSIPNMKSSLISCLSLFVAAGATIVSTTSSHEYVQFSFAAVYGLSVACFATLRPVMMVEMLGIERLTNAFGLSMTFQGIACLIGLPISGIIFDYTQDYNMCFYFSGGCVLFSAILLMPLKIISKWEENKSRANS